MATMKDLALKIHQRTSQYTNLNQQIQDNSGNINTNLSKISTIEGQVQELQDKANALRGYKEYNANEAYSVGDIIEAEGLFKVIKAITAGELHPELSDPEYFVSLTEVVDNTSELEAISTELSTLKKMTKKIKFDTVELGGVEYPFVTAGYYSPYNFDPSGLTIMDDVNNTLSIDEDGMTTGFISTMVDGKEHIPYIKSNLKLSNINITAKDSVGTEIQLRFKLNQNPRSGVKTYPWFFETTGDMSDNPTCPRVKIYRESNCNYVSANIVNNSSRIFGSADQDNPEHIEIGKWYTIRQKVVRFVNKTNSTDTYKVYTVSELLDEDGELLASSADGLPANFKYETGKITTRTENVAFLKWNAYVKSVDMDIDLSNTWIRKVDPETNEVTIYTPWVKE